MSELQNKVEIHMEHIGMVYPADGKEVTALTDVTLDIQKGEFVSLVGPSGCGKTTLLRIVADLLQPTSGVITVGGTSPREARLKRRYGIVFQGAVLYDWRTVPKNVEMPLEIMKVPKADRVKQAKKMLELVNLTEFAGHYPKQLSGGMQQRVGIMQRLRHCVICIRRSISWVTALWYTPLVRSSAILVYTPVCRISWTSLLMQDMKIPRFRNEFRQLSRAVPTRNGMVASARWKRRGIGIQFTGIRSW